MYIDIIFSTFIAQEGAYFKRTFIIDNTNQSHEVHTLGEFKDDQLQNITGYLEAAHSSTSGGTSGALYTISYWSSDDSIGNSGGDVPHNKYGLDASRVARAGATTHGKQVGLHYLLKY